MSLRSDPLDRLAIPDGTHVEEHDLVADGDIIVGGQSTVEFGVRGQNVVAGERVKFGGDIEADGDCRLDMWCDVDGNVLVGEDAYLGERVHIAGQLMVSGDIDIGDDVDIEEGFEANGWIVIRNPVPTVVFLFIYLAQLLRLGEEEAAEEVFETLDADREADPVLIPRSSHVSDDAWRVSTPASVGSNCRLHGNIRATELDIGTDTELFGSLRAKSDITIGANTAVHGDVTTRGGTVTIGPGVHIRGDVACEHLELDDRATIDGTLRARGEIQVVSSEIPVTDTGEDDVEPAIVRVDGETDDERPGVEAAVVEVEQAVRRVEDDEAADTSDADDTGNQEPSETVAIPDAEETADAEEGHSDDGLAGALAEAEKR
ncbi:polymer-forming cytoskeletal protein [Halosegnis longus]|uniref:Acyltransferase n=1 Tax=Halosegnis longus TaxID=2216012 RepID=A0AAJ4RA53_9EURY|nr:MULTISPECIES: polymer-forming cytoskeletal protein [Halobacteriales]RNJ26972.1 acyltransferase [Salella cibi]